MGASRDFANEYLQLAADRMLALAFAFHGSQESRRPKAKVGRVVPSQASRKRLEKVRASA